jgi:hypothetical protein
MEALACAWMRSAYNGGISNPNGQILKEVKNISGQTITLYRDNLPSGVFFVRLTQGNKLIAIDKLVVTDR